MATLTAIFNAQDNLSKAMANAGNAGSKTSGIMQKLGKIGSVAMKGIITAVVAAGTALVAFGKKAVNVGINFETSMSQVMATMGVDRSTAEGQEAYEKLSAAAEKMGAETAFTASQAADALNYLALAGYDADKAAEALPTVLHLAGAGAMELSDASNMITDSMAALQMEVNQTNLNRFADQMAKTASTTNTSVAQLGEAILRVGANAANLRNGTTELNTQLGIMANVGIKGAEAGTKFRNILQSLGQSANKTSKVGKQWKKLGIQVYDTDGKMRDTGAIFADLKAKMEGWDQSKIDQVMATLFNKQDLAAAKALLAGSGDEYQRIFGIIEHSEGAAAAMYQTMLDNLKGDVDIFKSAQEALYLSIYKSINSTLRKLVQTGTSYMQRLNNAFKEGGFEGLVTELGNVLGDAVGVVVGYMPNLIDAGTNIIAAFVDSIGNNAETITNAAADIGVKLVDAVFQIAPNLAIAFTKVLGSAAGSLIGAVPKLFEAVPSKLYSAIGLDKKKVVGTMKRFGRNIKSALSKVLKGDFSGAFTNIATALGIDSQALSGIQSALSKVKNWATTTFQGIKTSFTDGFKENGVIGGITSAWNSMTDSFKSIDLSSVWSGIKGTASTAFENIKAAASSAKDKVVEWFQGIDWNGIWNQVANTASDLKEKLQAAAINAKNKVVEWFQGIDWKGIWNQAANTAADLAEKLKAAAIKAKNDVVSWFQTIDWKGIWNQVATTASNLREKLKAAVITAKNNVVKWFQDIDWKGIWNKVATTGNDLVTKLKAAATTAKNSIVGWFQDINWSGIWDGIQNTASALKEKIQEVVGKIPEYIGNFASNASNFLKGGMFEGLGDSIINLISAGITSKTGGFAAKIITAITSLFSNINFANMAADISNAAKGLGEMLIKTLAAGISAAGAGATQLITAVAGLFETVLTPENISSFAGTLAGFGANLVQLLATAISTAVQAIGSAASNLAGPISTIVNSLFQALSSAFSAENIATVGTSIAEFATSIYTAIGDAFSGALGGIGEINLAGIGAGAAGVVTSILSGIFSTVGDLSGDPNITGFIDSIGTGISTAMESLGEIVGSFAGKFVTWLFSGDGIGEIFNAGVNIVKLLMKGVEYGISGIASFTFGLMDGILESLGLIDADQKAAYETALETGQLYNNAISQAFTEAVSEPDFSTDQGLYDKALTNAIFGDFSGFDPAAKEKFLSTVWGELESTGKEFENVGEVESYFTDSVSNMWSQLSESALAAAGSGMEFTGDSVKAIMGPMLESVGSSADILSDEMYKAIASSVANGGIESNNDLMALMFGNLVQGITDGFGDVGDAADAAGKAAEELGIKTETSVNQLNDLQSQAGSGGAFEIPVPDVSGLDTATDSLDKVTTGLSNAQAEIAAIDMGSAGSAAVQSLGTGISTGSAQVDAAMGAVATTIATTAGTIDLTSQGTSAMNTLTSGLLGGSGSAVSAITSTGSSIKTAANSINLTAAGAHVMRGLVVGMNSMRGTLMATARNIANQLKQTIQSGMQVHSPSRFTDWIGRMTGLGLINSLEKITPKVTAAAAAMAVGVTSAFTPLAAASPSISQPAAVTQEYAASGISQASATISPYDTVSPQQQNTETSGERRIVVEIQGGGRIDISGLTREQAMELIAERVKPELMNILSKEIFEGGNGVYEF